MPSRSKPTEDVLSFDLRVVLQIFLSSPQNMSLVYRGMAKLVEGSVKEPWEARWWGESIRTTSGHCIKDATGHPLWPSDCIWWRCDNAECEKQHIGRITWCGHDFTGRSNFEGRPTLRVQEMFSTLSLPRLLFELKDQANFHDAIEETSVPLQTQEKLSAPQELVIMFDQDQLISPAQIAGRLSDVYIDYDYDQTKQPAEPPLSHNFTIRFIFSMSQQRFRSVKLTTPLRAEKEIMVFGRKYLEEKFSDASMISLPFFLFVDAFGLYRNMYYVPLTHGVLPYSTVSRKATSRSPKECHPTRTWTVWHKDY